MSNFTDIRLRQSSSSIQKGLTAHSMKTSKTTVHQNKNKNPKLCS